MTQLGVERFERRQSCRLNPKHVALFFFHMQAVSGMKSPFMNRVLEIWNLLPLPFGRNIFEVVVVVDVTAGA